MSPWWRPVCGVVLAASGAIAAVWMEVQGVTLGYQVSRLAAEAADLRDQQRVLRAEVARARSSAALEGRAVELGLELTTPPAGGVLCVDWRHPERARCVVAPVPEVLVADRRRGR
ncbi:MAG: hypothetical protein HYY93_02885 [Planctomycetes bacterium]|nr:hypothetical protein [Planctomycetota bacterium]